MEVTREQRKKQKKEAEHALDVLPGSAWLVIVKHLSPYDHFAFAMTCRTFLEALRVVNPKERIHLSTDLTDKALYERMPCFSMGWFQWVFLASNASYQMMSGTANPRKRNGRYSRYLYDTDLMYLAAFQGDKEVMRWLRSCRTTPSYGGRHWVDAIEKGASGGGHLNVLVWLRSDGWPRRVTAAWAARGGHLHILIWFHIDSQRQQGHPPSGALRWGEALCEAARGGHLHILRWARSQDPHCVWNWRTTCAQAARGGHLHILQWLRNHNLPCDWDHRSCAGAAEGGHLAVLQWLRSQDPPCDWNEKVCISTATSYGYQHVVDWINANS
uniref:F-box domain-containing protein n=1 Tax=Chloropicon primus TaxID=1764295 RepID=A0A7S2SYE7_9CHLO|mmetsp:Transcript_12539/g.34955  ORF Transcript_12539/g.34955 Transcript_12539/m.34955 type:complete len:328 (+) Transcript_12539:187-1170(+)